MRSSDRDRRQKAARHGGGRWQGGVAPPLSGHGWVRSGGFGPGFAGFGSPRWNHGSSCSAFSYQPPLLAISSWPPARGPARCMSALGRRVIDHQHTDHDADQQRRQKEIFHGVAPFTLQSRTIPTNEKFVGVGYGRPLPGRQLTFHGRDWINPARAGTAMLRPARKRPGSARPFANSSFEPFRTVLNYFVVVVTDAVGTPPDWPASAGRLAQAEKPNAAAQATMSTIRI